MRDTQIALLQTFADQAVIAIENVRLFNETQGGARAPDRHHRGAACDQRPRSTDTQPVFDVIAERAGAIDRCDDRLGASASTVN